MYCKNCGLILKEDETVCPSCNTPTDTVLKTKVVNNTTTFVNSNQENRNETNELYKKYGYTKLLAYCILEFFCLGSIFGLIALMVLFTQFTTAIKQKDYNNINKTRKKVVKLLVIGLILELLMGIISSLILYSGIGITKLGF